MEFSTSKVNSSKVKLWTIQDEKGWNELQNKGVLIPEEKYILPEWKEGYSWLKSQMITRIGSPEHACQFPIWAWFQYCDANKRRPDLRRSGHIPKGEIGYRIEIEKEENEILLSDFVLWHWPLCYKDYIASSEEEDVKNEKEGIIFTYEERCKSWEKIFDMNFDVGYYTSSFKDKKIQATFWNLTTEDIIKVDKFIAR